VAPGFSGATLTPNNDLKVTRGGSLALTTLTFHLSAKLKGGTPLEFDGRHTIVWEKRGGQWLIIHEHVSKPL
jgi:ketosteroid isomerase-like protein